MNKVRKRYRMLDFPQLGDERGNLVVLEEGNAIPFKISRLFYMYGTKPEVERGQHANLKSEFLLVNLAGSCDVEVDDGIHTEVVKLDQAHKGIYLEKLVWKVMLNFTIDSILLVISNEKYDPDEYIRDYKVFKNLIKNYA